MKTVATIEARMTSTRLPGKVLMPVLGKPLLELLIERLRRSKVDQVVIATTINKADDPIEELARRLGVGCFRGSEEDVLDRVLKAAQTHAGDLIVEITGDCPLVDPDVVNQVIDAFHATGVDYASNNMRRTWPRGMDVQVFPTSVLAEVNLITNDAADHEHVSLYIYEHPERYKLHQIDSGLDERWHDFRLTVDTPEDYALIKAIFEGLYPANPNFSMQDVLAFLDQHPELSGINAHIQQKPVR